MENPRTVQAVVAGVQPHLSFEGKSPVPGCRSDGVVVQGGVSSPGVSVVLGPCNAPTHCNSRVFDFFFPPQHPKLSLVQSAMPPGSCLHQIRMFLLRRGQTWE